MLVLALLLVQPQAEPPQAEEPAEIVVVGERLRRLRFSARVDRRGRVRCRIRRSSGDPELDAVACQAVRVCAARDLRSATAAHACVEEQLAAHVAALRERRVQSR